MSQTSNNMNAALGGVVAGLILSALLCTVLGTGLWASWNGGLAPMANVGEITWFQAVWLTVLAFTVQLLWILPSLVAPSKS